MRCAAVQATHFAMEMVQNADDCEFALDTEPSLTFVLEAEGTKLTVMNNETHGFLAKDVEALCNVNRSYKKLKMSSIGKKGIGFKSCFQVPQAPSRLPLSQKQCRELRMSSPA